MIGPLNSLGKIHKRQKNWTEMEVIYEKLSKLQTNIPDVHYQHAVCCRVDL